MTEKIYLASRYGRQEELKGYKTTLESMGYEVTSSWVDKPFVPYEDPKCGDAFKRLSAYDDWIDLRAADTLVLFTEDPLEGYGSRGGKDVEFGMALEREMDIFGVVPRTHVFSHLPEAEWFTTWEELIEALDDR